MIFTYFLIILGSIPMILFLFALIEHRHYRILFRHLLICAVIWLVVYGIAAMLNFHYWSVYQLPFLPKWEEIKIMLFVVGALFAIVVMIAILTGLFMRVHFRKWFADQGKLFLVMGTLCLNILVMFIFIMPAGQKYDYSVILDYAEDQIKEFTPSENNPVTAVLAASQQNCFSRSSSCRHSSYDNLVVVKNFKDQGLWVRMEIAFLNRDNEVMDVFRFGPVYLQAGETVPVVSKYEVENSSIWDRWTNFTEDRTASIQYRYQWKSDS
ncbi:hypothetical protein QYG89_00040 [Bacillus sp. B190/17]|uniref:Uncharacterized protein n=1 Tax=Bacillus lumedeiriae TaxID=3058829 RepID=A0ABW8I3P7_9BACI